MLVRHMFIFLYVRNEAKFSYMNDTFRLPNAMEIFEFEGHLLREPWTTHLKSFLFNVNKL